MVAICKSLIFEVAHAFWDQKICGPINGQLSKNSGKNKVKAVQNSHHRIHAFSVTCQTPSSIRFSSWLVINRNVGCPLTSPNSGLSHHILHTIQKVNLWDFALFSMVIFQMHVPRVLKIATKPIFQSSFWSESIFKEPGTICRTFTHYTNRL